ncbi:MAG TPA: sigma-70 family RNA polymerase sigma factor [Blastocatellia bacterium]|nr:sigma-70 family RNA polymerase sigma factor [Blastocatellia bacterium]
MVKRAVPSVSDTVTRLLGDWSSGDRSALEKLIPLVYDELRRLAHVHMLSERRDHTLQTTALVHEAYARLVDYRDTRCIGRSHFFAIAAQVMRRVLIEHARARGRLKRGGAVIKVTLDDDSAFSTERYDEVIALDRALTKLETIDPRKRQVVEMRVFAELDNREMAEILEVHENTVMRDWNFAKAWLRRELSGNPE